MDVTNKYGHATMIYNNRSKRSGMILHKFDYTGPDSNWENTTMYYILMSGGRYKYVLENNLNRLYTEVKPD
jgi:hypothetical protein